MSSHRQVLIVSKGHDYDHSAFLAMFDDFADLDTTLVEHPAAEVVLADASVARYDVVFFYDMCGVPDLALAHDGSNGSGQPAETYKLAVEQLVDRGTGIVALNHATVSWANWPLWRAITGSPFMLKAGDLRGEPVSGSGYRGGHGPLPNATVTVKPLIEHPVLEGLAEGFDITDELYLKSDRFGDRVVPLLAADYAFEATNFTPPPLAPSAEQASWAHPPGTDVVAWANAVKRSPVVAADLGDGPLAYQNPAFRRFVGNACRWVASPAARQWVSSQDR